MKSVTVSQISHSYHHHPHYHGYL